MKKIQEEVGQEGLKEIECLQRIERIILNPKAAGTARIGRLLDVLKKETYNMKKYRYRVNQLLYLASENGNVAAFDEILNKEGAEGIILDRTMEGGYWENLADIENKVEIGIVQPFITQDPELLDKMAEKGYAVKEQCWKVPDKGREVILNGGTYVTDAPDIYLAILCGNVNMVRYFITRGAGLEVPYRMDRINADWDQMYDWRNGCRTYIDGCYFGRCMLRPDDGFAYNTEYIQEGGFCIDVKRDPVEGAAQFTRFFHDVFTAAVLSQNTEMIAWIHSMLPEIRWKRSLESAVAFSNKKVTEYMLECYPEILDYMKLSSIYEGKNIPLLKAFAKRHPDSARYAVELERYLEWNSKLPAGFPNMEVGFGWNGTDRTVEFYRILLEYVRKKSIAAGIRREIFHILLSELPDPVCTRKKSRGEKWQKKMIAFFHEINPGICEDYTGEIIDHGSDGLQVIKMLGENMKGQFLSIDVYQVFTSDFALGDLKWEMEHKETIPNTLLTLMKYMKPKELRAEVDGVTKKILDRNRVKFIRLAQKRGYINCRNALALYEYALKNPKCEEEILLILLQASANMDIEERFAKPES